jgi:hypothetical protein
MKQTETRIDVNFSHILVELDDAEREKWSLLLAKEVEKAPNVIYDPEERVETLRMLQYVLYGLAHTIAPGMFLSIMKYNDVPWMVALVHYNFRRKQNAPYVDVLCKLPTSFELSLNRPGNRFPLFLSLTVSKLREYRHFENVMFASRDIFITEALNNLENSYEDIIVHDSTRDQPVRIIYVPDADSDSWKKIAERWPALTHPGAPQQGPLEEYRNIGNHLSHTFVQLDYQSATFWIDFANKEKQKLSHFVHNAKIYTATKNVIDAMLETLQRSLRDEYMDFQYLSILEYDHIPWIIVHAYVDRQMDDDDQMYIDLIFRTPSSYEHMQTHCADGKNLLPTLISLTAEKMSERHTFSKVVIVAPYQVTNRILTQMSAENPDIMYFIEHGYLSVIHILDAPAFKSLWKTRKHCPAPIAGFCGGCMQVAYCSKECAAENWAFHRHECPRR